MGFFSFEGAQPHRYTTIQALRDQGISTTKLSDADAPDVIELASSLVMRFTDQWFVPVLNDLEMNGQGDPVIHHPKLLPILDILQVALINIDIIGDTALTTDEFAISTNRRFVQREPLVGFTGRKKLALDPSVGAKSFPRGVRNVRLKAIFGWLDNFKDICTKTTQAVGDCQGDVTVESTIGISAGDVIIAYDSNDNFFHAILTEVDSTTKTLKFDMVKRLPAAVDSGATLCAFGRVPPLVERATIILVEDLRASISSSAFKKAQFQSGIVSERTDNYSYRLASPVGGDLGSAANSTGNLQADNILRHYTAPQYIGFA